VKDWSRKKKEALFRDDWAAVSAAARKPEHSEPVPRYEVSTSSTSTRDERDGGQGAPPPAIVLVRPQLGENIGKAARAMLNFGLTEMRLVSPRDGWPNPSAGPAASGADSVLQNAKVYDSVAAATADCEQVFATTVRKRGITKPVVTPEQASTEIHASPGRSAILFGPERSGLETDDVAVARTIITVPINPEFGSLNLAQAVILVAYEWSKGLSAERGLSQPSINPIMPPAPQEELDGMIGQLDTMLMGAGFFHLPDKMQSTRRTLRTLLTKPGWSSQEIRTLRGVLSSLAGKKPRG
jgi:tRNA/rRNA methyltransferase